MMCLAGIELEIADIHKRRQIAEAIGTKARVHAQSARTWHGHVYVLVDGRGWVKSVDLLQQAARV